MPRPPCVPQFKAQYPGLADIYTVVAVSGLPNYRGARLPVPHGLNIPAWRSYEHLLRDPSLVDMLEFGFLVGFNRDTPPTAGLDNHSSARVNPIHVSKYIETELEHETIVGPFKTDPFSPLFRLKDQNESPQHVSKVFRTNPHITWPWQPSYLFKIRIGNRNFLVQI